MQALRATPTAWGETWTLALQALRANKVRAMLTMLGVVIGSVHRARCHGGSDRKRYVIGQIESVGSNLIYAGLIHSTSTPMSRTDEMMPGDLEAVKQSVPGVMAVAGIADC